MHHVLVREMVHKFYDRMSVPVSNTCAGCSVIHYGLKFTTTVVCIIPTHNINLHLLPFSRILRHTWVKAVM